MRPVLHILHPLDIRPDDVGVTVRRGLKWTELVQPGSWINICECRIRPCSGTGIDYAGTGKILSVSSFLFCDIPARIIELEHEAGARLYSGLLKSMRRAYGQGFEESEIVTVLMYERMT